MPAPQPITRSGRCRTAEGGQCAARNRELNGRLEHFDWHVARAPSVRAVSTGRVRGVFFAAKRSARRVTHFMPPSMWRARGGRVALMIYVWRAKRYGVGPMPCGSATTRRSIAAAEKGQAVGTGARRSATRSAGGCGGGGEPSGATSVRRGQGEAKRRCRRSRGKTETGGAEHTRGKRPCQNVRQQRRVPGKEVGNGRGPAARWRGPSVRSLDGASRTRRGAPP
jgi:hypothetical protein